MQPHHIESDAPDADVRCPRCGYDQRGVVATWQDSCPLNGTCSECGLQFFWAEVIVPDKFEPPWCIEFVPRSKLASAFATTLARAVLPHRFWSRVQMAYPVRPRRLIVYALGLALLIFLFCYVPLQAAGALWLRNKVQKEFDAAYAMLPLHIARLQAKIDAAENGSLQNQPEELQMMKRNLALVKQNLAQPPRTNISYARAAFEAVATPWSGTSAGMFIEASGSWPYYSARSLWARVFQYIDKPSPGQRALCDIAPATVAVLCANVALAALLPLSFVLLPYSRRRAQVRFSHLMRAGVYSLSLPALAMLLWTALIAGAVMFPVSAGVIAAVIAFATVLALPISLLWWWVAVTGRYLHLPHAWLTAGMLWITCILFIMAGAWVAIPNAIAP